MEKSIINKKILCPVCGKYYFEKLTAEEIEDGITQEDDFCTVCGWNYDEKQMNDFDLKTNLNEKSINEYKKWFENQITVNPNYNFLDANKPQPQHHLCPICEKHEFKNIFSFEICPFCGWEDDGTTPDDADYIGSNGMTISEYKKKYEICLKADPKYKWKNKINK